MIDTLSKYLFEDQSVRAQTVRLHKTWQDTRAHHTAYPPAVTRLLGELVAASTLLAANLKFDGSLVLQLQGDGPIALIVVECHADLHVRATVKLREAHTVPENGGLQSLLNPGGKGRFIVILDPRNKTPGQQPYQGVVALTGDTVAAALEHYMRASEQLDTRLWLQADEQHAAGLLLQRLPPQNGDLIDPKGSEETWQRAQYLADTIRPGELCATDSTTLIHRLYSEETLRMFTPLPVRWRCTCQRGKVADMLRTLGENEINAVLREQASVTVNCEFCGKQYVFDAVDCAGLFAGVSSTVPSRAWH